MLSSMTTTTRTNVMMVDDDNLQIKVEVSALRPFLSGPSEPLLIGPLASGPAGRTPGARSKMLVIDDQSIDLMVMAAWLESEGFEVTTHDSPMGAVPLIMQEPPDVLFLNVQMPGLSGPALLDVLRQMLPAVPPVIFVSCTAELAAMAPSPPVLGCIHKTHDGEAFLCDFRRLLGLVPF